MAVDAKGRVYVSDPRYVGDEPRELDEEAVYPDRPRRLRPPPETTAKKPNGLAVSPDGTTLYVSDNGPERQGLLALTSTRPARCRNPKVLKNFGNGRGIDGMTVTADGRIVAAAGRAVGGVYVYAPDGTPLDFIPVPETPTNVEFGGPDRRRSTSPPARASTASRRP